MKHVCHAFGCNNPCSPVRLMCAACWQLVDPELQHDVYRTVKLRDPTRVNASWAPWWRAQAKAIHCVAMQQYPNAEHNELRLKRELDFADVLERR